MRRLIPLIAALLAVVCVFVSASSCKRRHRSDDSSRPSSLIRMGDARAGVQLTRGFYDPEQGNWRWTARQFSAVLRPPQNARSKGARLVFQFAVPEVSLRQLHALTLSARINGFDLPPETYSKSGNQVYQRDVPASLFGAGMVEVDFSLDKALPPSGQDLRELGVAAQAVGLEAE